MKKIIACLMVFIMIISLCACGNNETAEQSSTDNEIIGETSFSGNTFIINGEPREVADYYGIEDAFVLELYENGYEHMLIYDTDELTAEILENRTQQDSIIIERVIGMVTNREQNGDGIVLNTSDTEYNYISYRSVDFETCDGTIILTYFIYNPGTDYVDDIMERYDFLLDREYED